MTIMRSAPMLLGVVILGGCAAGGDSDSTFAPTAFQGETLAIQTNSNTVTTSPTQTGTELVFRKVGGIYVMENEVTQTQWSAVMGTAPWSEVPAAIAPHMVGGDKPAYNISYNDAQALANALRGRTSLAVAIPTQSQWTQWVPGEYAWGSEARDDVRFEHAHSADTAPLGGLRAANVGARINGLANLTGNVREWTSSQTAMGGAWCDQVRFSGRSVARATVPADIRHPANGLRLIINP
jgi:formylglycine-generating enzyme required for sulfatase activity